MGSMSQIISSIKGKRVDVYQFTHRHELISLQKKNYDEKRN